SDTDGRRATALLNGPEAYEFTARAAVAVLRRVLAGEAPPGFRTPVTAYGPGLADDLDGVTLERLPAPLP
ncbi:MAG TPA: hypothetical protein VD813_05555, partial [Pseudonocardia sp.]|nr:hypothetical protein [Pseudonocardia sp.]